MLPDIQLPRHSLRIHHIKYEDKNKIGVIFQGFGRVMIAEFCMP